MNTLIVQIDDALHRRLRFMYAETRQTMADTVRIALTEYFEKIDAEKKEGEEMKREEKACAF